MTDYNGLFEYMRDICLSIDDQATIFFGREEVMIEVDQEPNKRYIYILPFTSTGTINETTQQVEETWQIGVFVYKQDRIDSAVDQNDKVILQQEMSLVNDAMGFCDKLIRLMNNNALNNELRRASQTLQVLGFDKESAIKLTAHLLTGSLLSITLDVPDNFNYCSLPSATIPSGDESPLKDLQQDLQSNLVGS